MQFSPNDPDIDVAREHLRSLRRMTVNEFLTNEAELAAWSTKFIVKSAPNAAAMENERSQRIAALTQNSANLEAKLAHIDGQLGALPVAAAEQAE